MDNPKANDYQVGGDHYKGKPLEHWDLAVMFGWSYLEGQIIKYVMRYKRKNGLQDLEKAKHYLEKLIETKRAQVSTKCVEEPPQDEPCARERRSYAAAIRHVDGQWLYRPHPGVPAWLPDRRKPNAVPPHTGGI